MVAIYAKIYALARTDSYQVQASSQMGTFACPTNMHAYTSNSQVESSYWYSQKLPFVVVEIFIVAFHIPPGI